MNEPKNPEEIDLFVPTAPCWFCGKSIKQLWRIENRRGKIMAGEYCSEGCCSKEAWGPIYRDSTFVRMSGKPLVEVLTRGGKREGAGRKPRATPREAITVRLEPQDAAKLRDLCAAKGLSQAEWITDKIRRSKL